MSASHSLDEWTRLGGVIVRGEEGPAYRGVGIYGKQTGLLVRPRAPLFYLRLSPPPADTHCSSSQLDLAPLLLLQVPVLLLPWLLKLLVPEQQRPLLASASILRLLVLPSLVVVVTPRAWSGSARAGSSGRLV